MRSAAVAVSGKAGEEESESEGGTEAKIQRAATLLQEVKLKQAAKFRTTSPGYKI